jgi:hypothetical protein
MIEVQALQGQVRALVEDLRAQVASDDALAGDLRREYDQADQARRVGGGFDAWLEGVLDQAAVAWVLGCVFVRFCEDNRLVQPRWLGGPNEWASVSQAVQARQAYVIANPLHNDRHWLREAFSYLAGLRATGKLFDEHNPVWRFDISGQAAEALSDFFRRGDGFVSLAREDLDTRFLGDVYQDLSAHARQTYALLQTPGFVEEFILDRAFEPAVAEFGLPQMSVIDPTCGSGHFLLGAFDRLVARWREREPGTDVRVLVERALGQVTGVDVNPFAVAIARFRLMVAALRTCGLTELERAPQFPVRVATGDALLPWGDPARAGEQVTLDGESLFAFATEDAELLAEFLRPRQYAVVVGNPPYITVKDKAQNARYRELYPEVCHRQYALTVPFAQRFFELAKRGGHDGHGAGWVGQITSNSFMKREFGKKLIEDYLSQKVELTEVIDTSGAYIPGHGTPTVILIGRDRLPSPRYSGQVRTVLGIRGEPSQPDDPARGLVWTAIVNQIDRPGSESDWISVTDFDRDQMITHPWSLSGGGASSTLQFLETGRSALEGEIELIGYTGQTNADSALLADRRAMSRFRVEPEVHRQVVVGEVVRDYLIGDSDHSVFLYDVDGLLDIADHHGALRRLWPMRTVMWSRRTFAKLSYREDGRQWWEWHQVALNRLRTPLSIAFAFVATHNHFVLDRGGKVFKQSAPMIKLPEGAGEDEHLRLLGVLNSSTACFWLKQVSHNKGRPGAEQAGADEPWEHRFEFTGTKLQEFPLPDRYPLELARELDALATRLGEVSPAAVAESGVPTRERLRAARDEWHSVRGRMIALQEELDWHVYRLYELTEDHLTTDQPPELTPAERAFAIVLARQVQAGEASTTWFKHHNHKFKPVTELPAHWPAEYRDLVQRRIDLIESDRHIGLIERPECKRRWSTDGWDAMQTRALRDWLLDRLEAPEVWGQRPVPMSVAQLADRVRHDEEFRHVLDLWVGNDQHDPVKTLSALVADEQVPFLASYRYKPSGLRKRAAWERTWELQRLEDQGKPVEIEVPPKYTSGDFVRNSYWRNRGKLDVPKERFISYPKAGRDGDDTDLLGWAGWDHLAQAQALATIYLDRKQQGGWSGERLLPLLAGLAELEPWLHQWHADPQPGYTGSPAEFFTGLIDTELAALDADRTTLATIRGVDKAG